ncbi:MAG TPA: NADH:flavin oxidoreductase [Solirubrobacteraceae bacterium]|nr:NADH:flavin oxidoreductase [Solirubrobacteraceae bacterium]
MTARRLLEPADLGPVHVRNRIIRAGTSESMALGDGAVSDALIALYATLARNLVGTIFTGHLFCHERGRYARNQTGIARDAMIPGLRRLVDAVHAEGGAILAQVAHAGSQSRAAQIAPLAPSAVPNALTGRPVPAAADAEIEEAIDAFAAGARRAIEAGFDGVHIHGANGYLISEFLSPLANRRDDTWGGDAERRSRFAVEVVRAVRAQVPRDKALTMKLGVVDAPAGGLTLDAAVSVARAVAAEGLDALEISCGVMQAASDSARQYVAVDSRRAAEDLLLHRLLSAPAGEAYFVPWMRRVREDVGVAMVAVGGMRRTETMERLVASGDADFVAMARPFIREPDIARQIVEGRTGLVDCTSCNLCLTHEGHHSLRCWRVPRRRLAQHAAYRFSGGLRRAVR